MSHVGRLALNVRRESVIPRHLFVGRLFFWWRAPHLIIVIVVQTTPTCEVGRTLVFMCTSILKTVSLASIAKCERGWTIRMNDSGWMRQSHPPADTSFRMMNPTLREGRLSGNKVGTGERTYWNLPIVSLISPDEYS